MIVPDLRSISKILAAALVALFVTLIATFLALAGVISTAGAQVVLIIAYFVGALFIWVDFFPKNATRKKAVTIIVLGMLLGALDWWALKQKRAHLYVSRTQFVLGNAQAPENFVSIIFRNDSDMDIHIVEYARLATGDVFFDNPDKQRAVENSLFKGMLDHLASATPQDKSRNELELQAHGDSFASGVIPATYSQISTMTQAVYFMGRMTYTDENGTHHTDFCNYIHNRSEPIFSCKGHNEAP